MKYSLRPDAPADVRAKLIEHSDLSARLFHSRGITDADAARIFLAPNFEAHSHDPFLLRDAEKAADRVIAAVKNGQNICIYSDYDMDGIPAGVMMHDFFTRIGHKNFTNYIPHRHDEGFGLNIGAIADIADGGANLIITLDCGITDVVPVKLANDRGMDVIITDHHTPPAELPAAYAIVNPRQAGCEYPDKNLCGSGVGWKLIQAILKKERFGMKEGHEKWLLDMVGMATLSDMVALSGENRMLAHYGLAVLRKTPRKGLVKLFKKIGVKQASIVEDDVGFSIAPRVNAASRMGVPMDAFLLLVADDETVAEKLADHLDHINSERKGVVASLVKEVKKNITERYSGSTAMPSALVLGNPEWRPALLGLAANTCAEEFGRPVFLWGRDGDGLYKGSCRTGDDSHLVQLMTALPAQTFLQFGGHMGAGGFTIHPDAVFNLEETLNAAYKRLKIQDSGSKNSEIFVDGIFRPADITWKLYDEVNRFAPFGTGNPKPLFMIRDATISAVKKFGKEKNHLEILLDKGNAGNSSLSAIAFFKSLEDFGVLLAPNKTVTVIGTLEKSTFKWKPELRIRIVDIVA